MGLRINQNIAAMNAYRNLSVTDGQMSKSLEKLSSGFRINRAADDASGLSISEGLRAQTGGLKVAVRNAQDGISVVQTAEGALTEVHSILQRMRDLSVQASNTGSQDVKAREAAQSEFGQLNEELDRIGNTTSYGKTKLLDGSFGLQGAKVSATNQVDSAAFNGNIAASDTITVKLGSTDSAGGAVATVDADFKSVTLAATGALSTAGTLTNDSKGAAALQKALQTDLDHASTGLGAGKAKATVNFDSFTGKMGVSIERVNPTGAHDSLQVISDEVGTGVTATFSPMEALGFTVGTGAADTDVDPVAAAGADAWTASGAVKDPTGTGVTFQVGANNSASDKIKLSVAAINSTTLGTVSANLVTDADSAVDMLDAAIESVSTTRATLGAYQNRFEHTINNLNVAVENLSASESRIRDTDMAQEMVAFTRSQILSQAGTSMLAQANQAPQSVLSLLR